MVKNPPANAGDAEDASSIPGSGRSPEGGTGNPLHYPCLENSMDRGAWQATVHGVTESDATELTHAVNSKKALFELAFKAFMMRPWQSNCTGLIFCPCPRPLCSARFCSFSFFPLLGTQLPPVSLANSHSSLSLSSQRALL